MVGRRVTMIGSKFAWCAKCYGGFVFTRTWGELLPDWTRCPCCLSLIDASGEFGKTPEGVLFVPALDIKDRTYKRPVVKAEVKEEKKP